MGSSGALGLSHRGGKPWPLVRPGPGAGVGSSVPEEVAAVGMGKWVGLGCS